jgi:DNA-binding winged helix-turn-helix (wHTH) protein
MMSNSEVYEFEGFRLEANKRLLMRNGTPVPLTAKVFDTLLHLVQRSGHVVEKEELMRAIWPDTVVEENNLNQNISTLRRVLGQNQAENRYIVTIPGRGYRFVGNLTNRSEPAQQISAAEKPQATIAILPFENLSADREKEYLADGLTEETIASLGQIDPNKLSVIGRTSVMIYKRTTKTLAEIGRELDATHLVESSLRAEGGRLRITSKLIRAKDQVHLVVVLRQRTDKYVGFSARTRRRHRRANQAPAFS